MHPLRPRLGRKTTICIVIGIWVASTIVAVPPFLFYTTGLSPFDGKSLLCYGQWPDGEASDSTYELM